VPVTAYAKVYTKLFYLAGVLHAKEIDAVGVFAKKKQQHDDALAGPSAIPPEEDAFEVPDLLNFG